MVKINRTQCAGCPHFVIVRTLNRPDGELSCRFAFIPCDTCRQSADQREAYQKSTPRPQKHRLQR